MDSSIDMDFENKCLNTVKQEVLDLAKGIPGQIFLFGSRVNGSFKRGSDIDIGFIDMPDEDFRKIRIRLGLFWEESFVPYHLDLVNFNHVKKSFGALALEKIEIWRS